MGPLDPATLSSLRELDPSGVRGLLPRLVEAFDRTVARQAPELDAACGPAPDLARMGRAAHTLKSASAHLGALAVAAQCQALECQCHAGDAEGLHEAVAQLRQSLTLAQSALRGLLEPTP